MITNISMTYEQIFIVRDPPNVPESMLIAFLTRSNKTKRMLVNEIVAAALSVFINLRDAAAKGTEEKSNDSSSSPTSQTYATNNYEINKSRRCWGPQFERDHPLIIQR